jgi:DNA-binding NarL/FixJ family response regulator
MLFVMSNRVSVLMIAPPGRLSDGLRVLLRASDDIVLAGQAGDTASGLCMLAECLPALVLLDASLPGEQALHVLQHVQGHWPHVHCLVLAHTLEQERLARQAGADAVLQPGFSAETLFHTIEQVMRN